ncbi:MAG: HIT domain-containing protein [Patescibacteria group bacterium]
MNSELRQDIVSGDWIVIAPSRAKRPTEGEARPSGRPDQLIKLHKMKRIKAPIKDCPFENLQKSGHHPPILKFQNSRDWEVVVVENKYPAFTHINVCASPEKRGPYSVMDGIGHHNLVITRDHCKNFPKLSKQNANLVFKAFVDYYKILANDYCLAYVSIFHNWGQRAGASIYHPHYQIIALPIVPPDVEHSLEGSNSYYKKHKKCVHCVMLDWELKEKKRIVYENKSAVVLAPFVMREPFELRVFPKKHFSYFEDTPSAIMRDVVSALQKALQKMENRLHDPDYNFFIHTSPLRDKNKYKHYHWHVEILPKFNISAGFEQGTGIEITTVDPDEAARFLR